MRGYEKDPDINERDEVIKILIEKGGANFDFIKSKTKMTPLHWITFWEDFDSVNYLLNKHPSIHFNADKLSPLDIAGITKRYKMVDLYLNYF